MPGFYRTHDAITPLGDGACRRCLTYTSAIAEIRTLKSWLEARHDTISSQLLGGQGSYDLPFLGFRPSVLLVLNY